MFSNYILQVCSYILLQIKAITTTLKAASLIIKLELVVIQLLVLTFLIRSSDQSTLTIIIQPSIKNNKIVVKSDVKTRHR